MFIYSNYINKESKNNPSEVTYNPLSKEEIWTLTSHEQPGALQLPAEDANGVRRPGKLLSKIRANWSASNALQIPKPTAKELESESHH